MDSAFVTGGCVSDSTLLARALAAAAPSVPAAHATRPASARTVWWGGVHGGVPPLWQDDAEVALPTLDPSARERVSSR